MGDARDFPNIMAEGLHLDPEFAPILDGRPPLLPDAPASPTTGIDMGVTAQPVHRFGQGVPWLDPKLMGPVFEHYTPGNDTEQAINRTLKLRSNFLGPDDRHAVNRGWGKNDAGVGLARGDWQMGGMPVTQTSDRFDTPGTRDRAERTDLDAAAAQQRGEKAPDPVGDLVRDK
jgi:hypothetical protein